MAGDRSLKSREFDSVPSESSSSWKLEGLSPPLVENEKFVASLGCASLTIVRVPLFWSTNVQVTVSPGPTSMFDTGLPSLQVVLVRPQPDGTVCDTK